MPDQQQDAGEQEWDRQWRISPMTQELEWYTPGRGAWHMIPRQEDVEYLHAMTTAARDARRLEAELAVLYARSETPGFIRDLLADKERLEARVRELVDEWDNGADPKTIRRIIAEIEPLLSSPRGS